MEMAKIIENGSRIYSEEDFDELQECTFNIYHYLQLLNGFCENNIGTDGMGAILFSVEEMQKKLDIIISSF